MLKLDATDDQIVAAINEFRNSYHNDYSQVRAAAKRFLAKDLQPATSLANELTRALGNWGAGRRKAPKMARHPKVAATLNDARKCLRLLASIPHDSLSFVNNERRIDFSCIPTARATWTESFFTVSPPSLQAAS